MLDMQRVRLFEAGLEAGRLLHGRLVRVRVVVVVVVRVSFAVVYSSAAWSRVRILYIGHSVY
jgi:hypothetical protein